MIPDDIRKAATATYEGLPLVYDGWDEDAVIDGIARALLNERERCARIAMGHPGVNYTEGNMLKWRLPSKHDIAAAIRNPDA
jgi:hypothetical protein